jgi:hypothetical protein
MEFKNKKTAYRLLLTTDYWIMDSRFRGNDKQAGNQGILV